MIKVNALYFKAAHLCVSRDDLRYYLNGVYIEPHAKQGAVLTATDGTVLFSIYDPEGVCERAAIVELPKGAMTAKQIEGQVEVSAEGIFRHRTYISEETCLIDATYPDYRRICRAWVGKHSHPAAVHTGKLAVFLRIARLLRQGESNLRLINGESEADPALIMIGDVKNAFGLLMPMRVDELPKQFDWFVEGVKPPQPQAEASKPQTESELQKAA